ncbi:MAG: YXWGXW repeat-containing protein [Candidatus Eremiobacteraeota bacterium]|nr:YXWGXW repeat-containing protein [Candidatus Eremiobacteraeota bacterium]
MIIDRFLCRLTVGAASLAFVALVATPAVAQSSVGITINGAQVDVEPAPIVQAGRVFVPLRGVFERLGASVVYDNGQIDATENGTDIALHIGSMHATVNGSSQTIDVAPFIVGASTYVPLRFISQALGATVNYDGYNRIVAISTSNGNANTGYQDQGSEQAPSFSEAGYDVSQPPPPIPEYDQPPVPEPNAIWQPGCWAWSPSGYYWVPGTWVQPPQQNLLWTPGFWSFVIGAFGWHPGYWAPQVGYYGGINYGGGYGGQGYDGGRWEDGAFRYNRAVSNVTNTTVIKNTYIYNTVVNNYTTSRTSYNGGPQGITAHPTAAQLAVEHEAHVPITPLQRQHAEVAAQDRRLLANVNAGKPLVVVAPRPFTPETKPAEFVPVKPEDKTEAEKLIVRPRAVTQPVRPVEHAVPPVVPAHPEALPPTHPEAAPTARPEAIPPARPEGVPTDRPAVVPTAHPEDVTPRERPENLAPPVHPEATVAPVRPHVDETPMRPQVAPPVHAPVVQPQIVHPAPVHPAVAPPVHPRPIVRPATPHPAVRPAPKPAPKPQPKPDHTPQ